MLKQKNMLENNFLFEKINCFVQKNNLIQGYSTLIIGFSGGPDSRLLLEWVVSEYKNSHTIIVAHLNHAWRTEATNEEEYCRLVAQNYNLIFVRETITTYAPSIKHVGSKEAFARTARRMFLEQIANQYEGIILLGHHQDDQIETFFLRLIRGTSPAGLACIKANIGIYQRPLLCLTKNEIITELEKRNITFCSDASNQDTSFLRNNIRKNIIPVLQTIDQRATKNIIRAINMITQSELSMKEYIDNIIHKISIYDNGIQKIKKNDFFLYNTYLQKKIIITLFIKASLDCTLQEALLDECIRFLSHNGQQHMLTKTISIFQKQSYFWIVNTLILKVL